MPYPIGLRRPGRSSLVHFQRSTMADGRRTLIVFAAYSPVFAHAIEHRVPAAYRAHHIAAGVWEIDEYYESAVWWAIAEAFGLSSICADCLAEQCAQLYQLVCGNLVAGALENMRRQWASQPTSRTDPGARPRPLSMDKGMVLRGAAVREHGTPHSVAAGILGIDWPASREDVTRAFRRAVLNAHPDRGGSEDAVKRVLIARDVLMG